MVVPTRLMVQLSVPMCVNPGQNVTGCMGVVSSQSFAAALEGLKVDEPILARIRN
jgi:hypothetical protein